MGAVGEALAVSASKKVTDAGRDNTEQTRSVKAL
jgi:hypothetical protein